MNPLSSHAAMGRHYCELVVRGSEHKAVLLRGAMIAPRTKTLDVIRQEFHWDKLHCFAKQSEILAFGLRDRASGGGNPNVRRNCAMKSCSKALLILFIMVAGISLLATRLSAQSTFASLTGTVRDTSGAVVPHANVSLTEVDTGIVRNTSTDGDGSYQFLNLLPGHYVVTVKQAGFQEFKTAVFELVARQAQRADATLTLATTATQVQVVSAAPLINTENGSVSDATRQLDLINAPFNFRTVNT
jgi:hypothetical protein